MTTYSPEMATGRTSPPASPPHHKYADQYGVPAASPARQAGSMLALDVDNPPPARVGLACWVLCTHLVKYNPIVPHFCRFVTLKRREFHD